MILFIDKQLHNYRSKQGQQNIFIKSESNSLISYTVKPKPTANKKIADKNIDMRPDLSN